MSYEQYLAELVRMDQEEFMSKWDGNYDKADEIKQQRAEFIQRRLDQTSE